jgi:AraC-like DNA-binding protein
MPPPRTAVAVAPVVGQHALHDARTTVVRAAPGELAWELWLRTPPPALAGMVAGLWAGDGSASYARHRTLPNGELWAMFNLGPPQRLVGRRGADCAVLYRRGFVSGLQDAALTFESVERHPRAACIRFLPRGAWAFFGGLPLHTLANDVADLDAVLGPRAGVPQLEERMAACPDLGAALVVLERWLLARIAGGPAAHPVARRGVERLAMAGGNLAVTPLARELSVSERHLNMVFQREVGASPKTVGRVARLGRVLDALSTGGGDFVQVALDCGYYDQAHFNREFRALTGLTPTEYLGRVYEEAGWREVRD